MISRSALAKKALKETQEFLDRALQGAKIGLWEWNVQSNKVYFSPEWKRQLGYQDHELRSRFGEFEERLHSEDRSPTLAALIAIVKHRETKALRASEERLRLAVTGGNVGIWEWDVGTNHLVWSDQLKAMCGWPTEAEDLTLKMFMDAIHPEDRFRIDAALQGSVKVESPPLRSGY